MPAVSRPHPSRLRRLLPAALLALACALALPAAASAETLLVNTLSDESSPYGCEDFGECSLREAIEKADSWEGPDTIEFEVAGTIALGTHPLPPIFDTLTIDATTLEGYEGKPLVEIDGSNTVPEEGGLTEGLAFFSTAGGSRVEGLAIGGFDLGIYLAVESVSHVCGNYVGVGLDGTTALPNNVGIETAVESPGNRIGAECFGSGGNVISGNLSYGIVDAGSGTVISANRIGVDATGAAQPNGRSNSIGAGVLVSMFAENTYIGSSEGEVEDPGNTIADNEGAGVLVEDGNSHAGIRGNSIYANSLAGIQIYANAPPAPIPDGSSVGGGTTQVIGTFNGEPETSYILDFYVNESCDPSGFGEGQEYLGSEMVTTDDSGAVGFSALLETEPQIEGEIFTATATDLGSGSTSRFSACEDEPPSVQIESPTPDNPTSSTAASFNFTGEDLDGQVASFECSLDNAAFAACSSPETYSDLADGSHHFEVRAVDRAGKPSPSPAVYDWTVDTTAPTTAIEAKPDNPSNESSPSFTFSGADPSGSGVSGFECRLDSGTFAACSSPSFPGPLADGAHSFEVRAIDNAGNADASPASYTWTVDSTPPTVEIEEQPSDPSKSSSAGFDFSGEDITEPEGVAFECSLDGEDFGPCESGQEYLSLTDGAHDFEVKALDQAGNASAPDSYTWTVDTTAPTTTIATKPSDPSHDSSPSLSFTGSDPGGSGVDHFECSLDNAAFADCTSPRAFEHLADGSHIFAVRAVDKAGNADASPAVYTWTIDTSQPAKPATSSTTPLATFTEAINGESVAVAPEEGKVYVQRPGQKHPTLLKEGQTIPVGSIVDATQGKVLLTSVNANGEAQSAYFYGGKFLVVQHDGSGLVILKLRGEPLACGARASGSTATASGKKGNRLWGSGHGNFRTEGNYGSATVQGTIWFTEDRCNGTFFKVKRGVVSVRDFGKGKTISLPAGKTYLANP